MEPTSHEPSPYEGLGEDVREKLPQPRTAGQVLFGVAGFLVMGLGGILVTVGFLGRNSPWGIALPIGLAVCAGGYALFERTRSRRRRSSTNSKRQAPSEQAIEWPIERHSEAGD